MPAPDTVTEALVEAVYPEADVREGTLDSEHASLVDTSKAQSLFDWTPQWRWRDMA